MMTILGGIVLGLSPRRAAEFSFLLGLPTLGAACGYKVLKAGKDDPAAFLDALGGPLPVAVGILVATVSAAIAVKWLVGYLSRGGFAGFGWWRVAIAAALGAGIASGAVQLAPEPASADTPGAEAVVPANEGTAAPGAAAEPTPGAR